jgi:hypothetical protein
LAVAGAGLAIGIPGGSARAAGTPMVESCGGKVVVTLNGVTLVARHFRVRSLHFDAAAIRSYAIPPMIGCQTARRTVDAYFLAELERPIFRCAGPSAGGRPCKVDGWLCEKTHPKLPPRPDNPAGMLETCTHFRFRNNIYVGQTYINFWELDYDHG